MRPLLFATVLLLTPAFADIVKFETVEINPDASVVPAVALSDIDGDKDLDLVAMSNDDIAWHENPGWARHIISPKIENLNVCMTLADITGDGLPELAAGADWQFGNTKSGGSLHILVRGTDVKEPWQRAALLSEPTIHRIRWADADGDKMPELYVAPLMGRNTTEPEYREAGVRLLALRPPADLLKDPWPVETINEQLHIMHNLIPARAENGRDVIVTAAFEGLTLHALDAEGKWSTTQLTSGSPQPWPKSGSSEIKIGSFGPGAPVMATIEPWHGNQLAVYTRDTAGPLEAKGIWTRHVIDETFNQGHALGWADFDGDGRDELAAGFREASPATQKPGLNLYRFTAAQPGAPLTAEKQIVDDGGMATEDFAVGDIDGDGRPDIYAGGRATHNLRVYLNRGVAEAKP